MQELNEGFDNAFGSVGIDYDKAADMTNIADVVSNALYELHEIMIAEDLYEKYPMQNEIGKEGGTVFNEYDRLLKYQVLEALTQRTDDGHTYTSAADLGNALTESSLKSVAEVLNETIGKEYGMEFSYENSYRDSKLLYTENAEAKQYEFESGDSLQDIVCEIKQAEAERE